MHSKNLDSKIPLSFLGLKNWFTPPCERLTLPSLFEKNAEATVLQESMQPVAHPGTITGKELGQLIKSQVGLDSKGHGSKRWGWI